MAVTAEETDLLDIEHRLICRILTEPSEWADVTRAKITDEFFVNPRHLRVWQVIVHYQREYGSLPTVGMLRQDFPRETYDFVVCREPINFLLDEIRTSRKAALLELGLEEITALWGAGDYDAAQLTMSHVSSQLHHAIPVADDMDITRTGDERLAVYLERTENRGELLGVTTGYKRLDKALGGLQKETLTTLAGFSKNGKSFVLLDWARAAHISGLEPLYIGFEMSNWEQSERIDSSRAGVSLTRLRNGTLNEEERIKIKRSIESLKGMPSFILSADRSRTMTISGIAAKIEALRPPVVFVDGVYMMEDENGEPRMTPRALSGITQGFKKLAQTYKIPIAISTQGLDWKAQHGKGRRMSRSAVGHSTSFLTDSDNLIGVEIAEDDPDIQILSILASRTTGPQDFFIRRDWDHGYFEELDYNPFESDGPDGEDDRYSAY